VLLRLIGKWLNAGVLEDGCLTHPETGSPQGGVVSPILSNIFLHSVLDEWFEREVRPRLKGRSLLIRYADDCAPRRCERTTSGVSLNTMLRER
jgi:retron-type reverse transcriptase